MRSIVDEYLRGGDAVQEAASLRDFGDKPLFVLTAGEHPESWMTSQKQSAALSTNSVWRVVVGSTHQGLLGEKQYAVQTSKAVLDVVTAVRTNQPLTRPTDRTTPPKGDDPCPTRHRARSPAPPPSRSPA